MHAKEMERRKDATSFSPHAASRRPPPSIKDFVDPYDDNKKLLPLVLPFPNETVGDGDKKVQAYNFRYATAFAVSVFHLPPTCRPDLLRFSPPPHAPTSSLCVTQNTSNMVPFAKPASYKPENWELARRYSRQPPRAANVIVSVPLTQPRLAS